jgi:hypothetical protein
VAAQLKVPTVDAPAVGVTLTVVPVGILKVVLTESPMITLNCIGGPVTTGPLAAMDANEDANVIDIV